MSTIFWKTLPISLQIFSFTFFIQQKVHAQEKKSDFSVLNQATTRDKYPPRMDVNISPPQFSQAFPPSPTTKKTEIKEHKTENHPFASSLHPSQTLSQIEASMMGELTSVAELSDIQPQDWALQFLQSLQQRYKNIQGYTGENLQKNRPINRYEFAVLLNAALLRINELQNTQVGILPTQKELETLQRLQKEFAKELATIRKKIDKSEEAISQRFSTTTKLSGRAQFVTTAVGRGNKADNSGEATDSNITFSNSIRLNFDTSFNGKDRLRIGLRSRNIPSTAQATGTDMARLSTRGDSDNNLEVSKIEYRFPVGEKSRVSIATKGAGFTNVADTLNPFVDNSTKGAISRFGRRNPIYRQGGGAGIGIEYELSNQLNFGIAYNTSDADKPDTGLSNSDYGIIAQLTFIPSSRGKISFTYVHSHNSINTRTGSAGANDPFNDASEAISANSLGLQGTFSVSSNLTLSGWLGYTRATAKDLPNNPTATIFNWAVTLALTNLGREGSVAGIVIGQPPKLIDNEYQVAKETSTDKDTSLHLEAFYTFPINDSISITPGILIITNPEHNSSNDTVYVGTLRTTFNF
ncbi:MAG: iron uptake porin [Calothrix sp. MO_167.B42]|nr:iron uptake porin [Calothrix sp. MO_167.B42]